MHDGGMYELTEYIVHGTYPLPPPPQQGSNIIHRPYFIHGPDHQRPFLLIEVHIANSRTLHVLLSQLFWQEDRETLLDDFDTVDWPYEWSQYMKAAIQSSVRSTNGHP